MYSAAYRNCRCGSIPHELRDVGNKKLTHLRNCGPRAQKEWETLLLKFEERVQAPGIKPTCRSTGSCALGPKKSSIHFCWNLKKGSRPQAQANPPPHWAQRPGPKRSRRPFCCGSKKGSKPRAQANSRLHWVLSPGLKSKSKPYF